MPPPTPPTPPASVLAASLHGVLALSRFTLLELFTLPGDALPQAITRLTGLTRDDVRRLLQSPTPASLEQALHTDPTELYYAALACILAYPTPLGRAILARSGGEAIWETTVEEMTLLAEALLLLLRPSLPQPAAAADTEAAVRAAFAEHHYALPHYLPPPAPPTPDEEDEDDDDGPRLRMSPTGQEQTLFDLALTLTIMARIGVPHPLGEALHTVPGLGSDEQLHDLAQRIRASPPETPQSLDAPDVLRLYLSLHVLALLCVADLQPALLARLEPHPDAPAPWHDPEQQQQFVVYVGTHVQALSELFDRLFGDRPAYQAAQATVRQLAALV